MYLKHSFRPNTFEIEHFQYFKAATTIVFELLIACFVVAIDGLLFLNFPVVPIVSKCQHYINFNNKHMPSRKIYRYGDICT